MKAKKKQKAMFGPVIVKVRGVKEKQVLGFNSHDELMKFLLDYSKGVDPKLKTFTSAEYMGLTHKFGEAKAKGDKHEK